MTFNFRYNLMVGVQVLFNFINAILLIKIFGVSPETDAYFILMTIFSAIYLIQLMPIEQFMYFYNDAKIIGRVNAEKFYNFGIMISILVGFVFLFFYSFTESYFLKFFSYKLDKERFLLLLGYSTYYKYVVLFMPVNYIFSSLLIAESKIGYSYISTVVPTIFTFFSLILSWIFGYKISFVLQITALGYFLSFCIYWRVVNKLFNYKFKFCFYHEYSLNFIKNSISMRFGHNINNFGLPFFTNNFLSFFQAGYVSQFYYAQRISMALQNIIVGPSSKALQSKISYYVSLKKENFIFYDVKKYITLFSPILIFLGLMTYFIIPYGLNLISSVNLKPSDIYNIKHMFLFFMIWTFILFLESPFDMILIAFKKSKIFIIVNFIFITLYLFIFFSINKKFAINSIFYSLIIGQMISMTLYFIVVNFKIKFFKIGGLCLKD